jgi:hypothetical protein
VNVEREYKARVAAMSVVERVRRAEALFIWSRSYLERSILQADGSYSRNEAIWNLALRQYGADPIARAWLEELRAHATRARLSETRLVTDTDSY